MSTFDKVLVYAAGVPTLPTAGDLLDLSDLELHVKYFTATISASITPQADPPTADGEIRYVTGEGFKFYQNGSAVALGISYSAITLEPSGFPNQTDSTISVVNGTRTLTIAPVGASFSYYASAVEYTVSAPAAVTWTNVAGLHFIYFNGATLTHSESPWDLTNPELVPVAALVWDTVGSTSIVLEERHGIQMDRDTHLYLHSTRGTQLVSGGTIPAASYTLSGTTDAHNSFAVDETVISDEDIRSTLTALADGSAIGRLWRSGAGGPWTWDTSTVFPKVGAGGVFIAKNVFSTPNWVLTDLASNRWVNWYLLAIPALTTAYRFVLIPGQVDFANLTSAQAESVTALDWGSLPFTEAVPIAQITYRTNTGYTTTGRCRIEGIRRLVGTTVTVTGGTSGGGTNLAVGTITDTTLVVTSDTGTDATLPQATTTEAGLMSGTDKTKLDGIAAGATAIPLASTNPADVGATAVGVGTTAARADHVHAHGTQTGGTQHDLAVASGAAGFLSGADKAKIDAMASLTSTAPADVTKDTAAVGVATTAARADHKHNIVVAAPTTIGTANADGAATSLARSDHVHAHGDQTSGSLHAAAVAAGASGFMTGADKTKLDGIATGADVTTVANATAASAAGIFRDKTGGIVYLRKLIAENSSVTVTEDVDTVMIRSNIFASGSANQLQVTNGSGSFSGAAKAYKTTNGYLELAGPTHPTELDTATASRVVLGSGAVDTYPYVSVIGPAADPRLLGPHIGRHRLAYSLPIGANTTTVNSVGQSITGQGTATARTVETATDYLASLRRVAYVSAATAGSRAGVYVNNAHLFGGVTGPPTWGGFYVVMRFSFSALPTTCRWWAGLTVEGALANAEPYAIQNAIGFGHENGGGMALYTNDAGASGSGYALAAPFNGLTTRQVYTVTFYRHPGTTTLYCACLLESATPAANTLYTRSVTWTTGTADMPSIANLLAPQILIWNGTTASVATVELISIYVEVVN